MPTRIILFWIDDILATITILLFSNTCYISCNYNYFVSSGELVSHDGFWFGIVVYIAAHFLVLWIYKGIFRTKKYPAHN